MKSDYPNPCFWLLFLLLFACQGSKKVVEKVDPPQSEVNEVDPVQTEVAADTVAVKPDKARIDVLEDRISDYKASRTREFDLLHVDLALSFDFENQFVNGEALLTLKPYFYSQNELVLDAQDFDIHSFSLIIGDEETELNYRYNTQRITAYLPESYSAEDTLSVRIKYTAKPNENPAEGSSAITDTKGLYFINPTGNEEMPVQIWTQGETEHNSKWFPTIDSPNERITQDFRITVDDRYKTISNGVLQSSIQNTDGTRTDRWVMNKTHAPYLAAVVVGDFVKIEDSWGDIPLSYFVEKEYEEGAKIVFQHTPEMIGFFSDLLGVKYPWPKYDQVVVRNFVSGAMENTTISVFMEELNLNAGEAIDSEWDGIIAHELFHQWFGNYVTPESWANLTLNEGFANYSEYLWVEHKEGRDEADMHHVSEMEQYLNEAKEKQVNLVRFYYDNSEDMFDSHSYAKGGRILHMLRSHIGDEAFFQSLNHYLTKHALSTVEVHELRMAFEEITGRDLNWYFNQWFLASGHPVLEYEVDYSQPENLLLTVSQGQNLEDTPLYKLPFKVSWYEGGKRFEKEFMLDKAWQQFAIETGSPVETLFFDEPVELLAEKSSFRGKDHFINQYNLSEFGVARYEALDSLSSMFEEEPGVVQLITLGLKDSFWAIRELALMNVSQHPEWLVSINNLEETVFHIAKNDSKNTVRSAAIEILALINADKYSGEFQKWMDHPSYYVSGAALGAYLDNGNNIDRAKIADTYSDENNIRIAVALADYYISEGITDKADWFHEKLNSQNGQSLYYFIGYYGDYFARMAGEETEQAIENLYGIGSTHQTNYIRIAAFQALFGFIDEPGILEKAQKIFEQEEDDLAKRYMEFFISSYIESN